MEQMELQVQQERKVQQEQMEQQVQRVHKVQQD